MLSNGIDANGRMIGFVYHGDPPEPDGTRVFLDEQRADRSVNAQLLADGSAYPAFYATLPADLRDHFAGLSRAARAAKLGLWPGSTADPDEPARIADLDALEQLVLWPKLFRRLVPYLALGSSGFDGFDAWLRDDPVDRDDALCLLGPRTLGRLHDVVEAAGDSVQLTVWPEDFVITPDPPAGHAGRRMTVATRPPPPAAATALAVAHEQRATPGGGRGCQARALPECAGRRAQSTTISARGLRPCRPGA